MPQKKLGCFGWMVAIVTFLFCVFLTVSCQVGVDALTLDESNDVTVDTLYQMAEDDGTFVASPHGVLLKEANTITQKGNECWLTGWFETDGANQGVDLIVRNGVSPQTFAHIDSRPIQHLAATDGDHDRMIPGSVAYLMLEADTTVEVVITRMEIYIHCIPSEEDLSGDYAPPPSFKQFEPNAPPIADTRIGPVDPYVKRVGTPVMP